MERDEIPVRGQLPADGLVRTQEAPQGPEYAASPRTLREGGGYLADSKTYIVREIPIDEEIT